jgi:hypothetical protein
MGHRMATPVMVGTSPPTPPSHPGHGGINSYPGSNPGHNPGYNPGHNPGYNPGHNPGYNPGGHHGYPNHPAPISYELRESHRRIRNLFWEADSIFRPDMGRREKMRYAGVLGQLSRELSELTRHAPRRYHPELRDIRAQIEDARFTLMSEDAPRRAHFKVRRANSRYDDVARVFIPYRRA